MEYEVTKLVEQPVYHDIEKTIHRFQEIPQEKLIKNNAIVERVTQVANKIQRDIVVDLKTETENVRTVERVIENPVHVDTVLEKNIEQIVTRDVEVPVEKIIEVDVGVYVENPVFQEVTNQEDIEVETLVETYNTVQMPDEITEHDDEELAREILSRKRDIEHQQHENNSLRQRFEVVQGNFVSLRQKFTTHEQAENIRLRGKLTEL